MKERVTSNILRDNKETHWTKAIICTVLVKLTAQRRFSTGYDFSARMTSDIILFRLLHFNDCNLAEDCYLDLNTSLLLSTHHNFQYVPL